MGIPLFLSLYKHPTCTDGKWNGDETGVDCGGSCALICPAQALDMIMKGDPQVIPVATSTYDVVAYIQNPNISGEVIVAPYTITIYSALSAVPLKTITGDTYIPANGTFALFQGPFFFASDTPARASLRWGSLKWHKNVTPIPELRVSDVLLTKAHSEPRIDAMLHNDTLQPISNVELVALVFDENGTIVHASRTVVDKLEPNQSTPLVYTWPAPFVGTTTAIEIVPRIFPDARLIK